MIVVGMPSALGERYKQRTVYGAFLIAVFAGCGAKGSRPIVEFPNREALAAIAASPVPSPRLDAGKLPEHGWVVEAAPAPGEDASSAPTWSAHEPWQPHSAWDRAVIKAMKDAGRSPRLTEAMSCVAREMGRWALGHDKAPPEGLRRFIVGACGVVEPTVGVKSFGGDVPAEVGDDAILERWGQRIRSDLVADLPAVTDAGFAFVRDGGRVIALLTYTQVRAQMDPFSVYPSEAGEVLLTGTLREQADYIGGYINQGRYGVAPCDVDPSVPRPKFRLTCKVHGEDETAWIELVYSQPRRVLAHTFARVLVRRPGTRQVRYQSSRPTGGQAATGTVQFAQGAVAALNEVRKQAALAPVRLSAAQSETATRLAPYYFSAALSHGSTEQLDTIALGLLAGWDVQGMIRDGGFISALVPQTRDPASWLDETLELPMGRSALLAEDIEEVALGPVLLDAPAAAGALVIGYRFHRSNDHRADVNRLLMRALHARKQRSLAAPKRLAGLDEIMRAELQKVHLGKAEPLQALERILESAGTRHGISMKGYVVETTSLDAVEIPENILMQPTLHLEIGVTHHKPKGAAWAQLVVVVAFQDFGN